MSPRFARLRPEMRSGLVIYFSVAQVVLRGTLL